MKPPVYPKHDPEWEIKRKQILYDQIKRTSWMTNCTDYQGKPRGRKAQFRERIPAKPRPSERYSWFDK
jgi:hypothetical protein